MKILAVIVTYADRFHLLEQVVNSCLKSNINNIIVVDNDSHNNSKKKLQAFSNKLENKLNVIWNSKNWGSAKAYKQGLKEAYKTNCDYIWLLDDDNKPRRNALKELIKFWEIKPENVKALLSFRPDREIYRQSVQKGSPDLVLSSKNSFAGFHIKDKVKKLFIKSTEPNLNLTFGEIAYAPYGGMFFHKSLLDEIDYPNEDYFLYSDDHDWSYRITKKGMKIYLILDSIIDDIDTSWALRESKSSVFKKIKTAPSFRVYYTFRNRMLFEKEYLVSNSFIYSINKLIYTIILGIYARKTKNFKVYLRALKDAESSNLVKYE